MEVYGKDGLALILIGNYIQLGLSVFAVLYRNCPFIVRISK
jgi:hypothetical protein